MARTKRHTEVGRISSANNTGRSHRSRHGTKTGDVQLFAGICLVFAVLGTAYTDSASLTVGNYLGDTDLSRFQKVFIDAFSGSDLQGIYYASMNMNPSQEKERNDLCKRIVELHQESPITECEKDYYLVGAHAHLKCKDKLPQAIVDRIKDFYNTEMTTAQEIYYKVASSKLMNFELSEANQAKIAKTLQELLKKDDLVTNGYAFNTASYLGPSAGFLSKRIEEIVEYADEVDGKLLQFEGGLSITSLLVNGIFKVAKEFDTPVPLTQEKAVKFANYFLSRRSVQTPKGVHLLIEALKTLSNAGSLTPLSIRTIGSPHVSTSSPVLNIAIVDLMGKAFNPLPQKIQAKIINKQDKSVVADNLPVVPKSSDKTVYALDMKNVKLVKGLYIAEINVDNTYKESLEMKVLGRLKVKSLEVGIADADGSTTPSKHQVAYQETLKDTLKADSTQKLLVKSTFEDADTSNVLALHQVFVLLRNRATDEEIIFIAETDSNKAYKVEIDFGARAADFAYKSGDYDVHLIVGDSSIVNSFNWLVADIQLKFTNEPKADESKKNASRQPLPEINHIFRTPDKRPPRIVSDVFTALCAAPLLLLFVFWSKLGINISNLNFAPCTIGFHLGFGGILALFGIFWWKLNMFETLRLLIPIAVFTFLCGNRLLRRIYADRVADTKPSSSSS